MRGLFFVLVKPEPFSAMIFVREVGPRGGRVKPVSSTK